MHTITERTEELVREAGIRTRIAFDTLVERLAIRRARPPRSTWASSSSWR